MNFTPRFSATKLKSLEQCALKYHLNYDLKLWPDYIPEPETTAGSVIHKICELWGQALVRGEVPNRRKIVSDAYRDVEHASILSDKDRSTVSTMIDTVIPWLEQMVSNNPSAKFGFEKEDFVRHTVGGRTVEIQIINDLLVYTEGGKLIGGDYKSSDVKSDGSHISRNKFQMSLYAWALSKQYRVPADNIEIQLIFPKAKKAEDLVSSILYTQEFLDEFETETLNPMLAEALNANRDKYPTLGFMCKYCAFAGSRAHCPKSLDAGYSEKTLTFTPKVWKK